LTKESTVIGRLFDLLLFLLAAEHFRLLAYRCGTACHLEVTSAPSLATFRTRLKTFLFTEAYFDIRLI